MKRSTSSLRHHLYHKQNYSISGCLLTHDLFFQLMQEKFLLTILSKSLELACLLESSWISRAIDFLFYFIKEQVELMLNSPSSWHWHFHLLWEHVEKLTEGHATIFFFFSCFRFILVTFCMISSKTSFRF